MTEKKKSGRRGTSKDDDRALWEFVAASVEPARSKNRVPDVEVPAFNDQMHPARSRLDAPPVPSRAGEPRSGKASSHSRVAAPEPRRAPRQPEPVPVALGRKRARRVAKGAEEIEARLDLHGMTQDDAHYALSGFIARCYAQGLRFVLVITGKGGAGSSDRSGRQAGYADGDDSYSNRPRGVLRRNVPRWLGSAELAPMVVSYTTAHLRHGGEGALYVQLRVKR